MNILQQIEKELIDKAEAENKAPDFAPGDTVKVNVKVVEGNRERLQALRVYVLPVRMLASILPLRYAKSLMEKVWSVFSLCILRKSQLKLCVVDLCDVRNFTI